MTGGGCNNANGGAPFGGTDRSKARCLVKRVLLVGAQWRAVCVQHWCERRRMATIQDNHVLHGLRSITVDGEESQTRSCAFTPCQARHTRARTNLAPSTTPTPRPLARALVVHFKSSTDAHTHHARHKGTRIPLTPTTAANKDSITAADRAEEYTQTITRLIETPHANNKQQDTSISTKETARQRGHDRGG